MDTPTTDYLITPKCESHDQTITFVCTHPDCFNKFICEQCQPDHNTLHFDFIKRYEELLGDNALKTLYSQKENLDSLSFNIVEKAWLASWQKIEIYFEDVVAKIRQTLQGLGHIFKSTISTYLNTATAMEDWESLIERLLRIRSNVLVTKDPDSQNHLFNDYLKTYYECSEWLEKNSVIRETKNNELKHKISQNFEGLKKFCEEFEGNCQRLSSSLVSNVEQMQISYSEAKLSFENLVPITTSGNIEALNAINLKQGYFAFGSNSGRISVWDSKTIEIRDNKDMHKGKITSLLHLQSYDLLVSSGVDKKLCVSRLEDDCKITTFLQIPIQETIELLTEVRELGSFVGLLSGTTVGIWSVKLTKFKGKDHYEVMLEGKIPLNQKAKPTKIINLFGKDMIAVSFDIGTISFFSLKEKKLILGAYAGASILEFCYCEKRQKIFARAEEDKLQVWSLVNNKPIFETDYKLYSQAKGPYSTIISGDTIYTCGSSNEILTFDLKTRNQQILDLQGLEAWKLIFIEHNQRIIFTNSQETCMGVVKILG